MRTERTNERVCSKVSIDLTKTDPNCTQTKGELNKMQLITDVHMFWIWSMPLNVYDPFNAIALNIHHQNHHPSLWLHVYAVLIRIWINSTQLCWIETTKYSFTKYLRGGLDCTWMRKCSNRRYLSLFPLFHSCATPHRLAMNKLPFGTSWKMHFVPFFRLRLLFRHVWFKEDFLFQHMIFIDMCGQID